MAGPVLTEKEGAEHVCRLVTTGRTTGQPHDIEIWFATTGPTVYFLSGNGPTADWYRNALEVADVEIRVGRRRFAGRARPVVHADERRVVGEAMQVKHGHWGGDPDIDLSIDRWLWEVPALAVDLVDDLVDPG